MRFSAALAVLVLAAALVGAAPGPAASQARAGGPTRADSTGAGPGGTIAGRVLSAAGRRPLEGAAVLVHDRRGRLLRTAATDAEGRYRLAGLPAGRLQLEVVTADHELQRLQLEVPPGSELRLNVVLTLAPPSLPPLLAIGERTGLAPAGGDRPGAGAGSRTDPGLRSLASGPGSALAGAALAARPEPPDGGPGAALYVRGGAADLKRVYLDGAPVYSPYHLGGLMDVVPEGVLRSARLYTGGAPLAYDGGLSYVLDLRTRAGRADRVRSSGHLDLMGGAVRAEGGGSRVSYLVSGRRAHAGASGWLLDDDLPYGYRELLGRVDLDPGAGHRLSVTGFHNRETVRLGGAVGLPAPDAEARWGNDAASVRYGLEAGDTRLTATAAASRFTTRLPVSGDRDRLARSETRHERLALDAVTDLGRVTLAWGGGLDVQRLDLHLPPAADAPAVDWTGRSGSVAGYGAATVRPHPDVSLTGGLRGYLFEDGLVRVSPRAALGWQAADATRLGLSAGRFHQRLVAPESILSADLGAWPEALDRATDPSSAGHFPGLDVASASHVTVRLRHRPRDELALGLEGHFKTFDELADGHDLHASGAELWIDWSADDWRAGAGYALDWAWSDAPADSGVSSFRGRQLLSARAEAPLPSGLRVAAKLRASSGLPFTRVPLAPSSPQEGPVGEDPPDPDPAPGLDLAGPPDGSYLRLDLVLSRPWETGLLGTDTVLRPYVRLLNALDRRDALFYQFDPSDGLRPRALDTMPVVPVVGVEWELR